VDVPVASLAWFAGLASALVLAALAAISTQPTLQALSRQAARESEKGHHDEDPPDYRHLATVRLSAAVGLTAATAGVLVVSGVPIPQWPLWVGLATVGVLLGWIDAATTWLPLTPTHVLWSTTGLGLVAATLLTAATGDPDWWRVPAGGLIGALGYAGFLAAVWWVSRGQLGFGDVRLALALGAATGASSLATMFLAALLGTAAAGIWAVIQLLRRRRDPFPYGPFLLAGAFLAPLLT